MQTGAPTTTRFPLLHHSSSSLPLRLTIQSISMTAATSKIAIIGSGISGAVCASILAGRGLSVTVFDSGRGAGGRMSQRRERMEDGRELFFDHGAPYFTVGEIEVLDIVRAWEARGFVAEWKEFFACFDKETGKFVDFEEEGTVKKYVGVPGMNSICKALCSESGIEAKFGLTVGKMDWLQAQGIWSLIGMEGQDLGKFDGVVVSDKNVASSRFTAATGRPPPLDISCSPCLAVLSQDVPVRPCFALMLGFSEPLSSIPVNGFSFKNSKILSGAFCDSSKPGRSCNSSNSQCWVIHSTAEYAADVISRTGLKKLSTEALDNVSRELYYEFQAIGPDIPQPFFMKAHRWGSAFPASSVGGEDKCLWDKNKKLAICGDFCSAPTVEGALLSGMRAASKLLRNLSNL